MRALSMLFCLSLAVTLVGCPGNENPVPPDAFRPDGGPRDAYVADTHTVDAYTAPDANVDGGLDGGADAGDAFVADAGPDAGTCTAATGCYQCAPVVAHQEQFLNHCTAPGVNCQAFVNDHTRLPHLNADGTLPPRP